MITAPANFQTANLSLQKKPLLQIEIAGYPRVFVTEATSILGQVKWIESIEDLPITVSDLDGGANLGELTFTVQDFQGLITADFPTFVFEGKAITLKTGFVGLSLGDFVTLFTGVIDTVASANDNNSYTFTCTDNTQALSKLIYATGDDGFPTDSDHPRTLNGHPLDIFIAACETEAGISASGINIRKIIDYRNTVFAGVQFTFRLTSPPKAKDFLEQQIMRPLGGWIFTNNLGQIDVNFFYRNDRATPFDGAMIASFANAGNVIVGAPFPVPILHIGNSITVEVPTGATKIQFGVNDEFATDNIGGWGLTIGASSFTVNGKAKPWDTTANPDFPYPMTGSTATSTLAVTAGTNITIIWTGGTVQIGVGAPLVPPIGDITSSNTHLQGTYAYLTLPNISVLALTADNLQDDSGPPLAMQADLVNTVLFSFDKDSQGDFQKQALEEYDVSTARYGQFGSHDIESDGMQSGFQAFYLAALTSRMIFYRYGLKNITFDQVPVFWDACLLEPGDIVDLTYASIPDREAGVIGISGKLFEVLDRTWNFNDLIVTVTLLDASYLSRFGNFLIAPDGMADYTGASAHDKNLYMFQANNSDEYSDASPAHALG